MLHTPLLGHLPPKTHPHKLPSNYTPTFKEQERYYRLAMTSKHLYEPNLAQFKLCISEERPFPPLQLARLSRPLGTLPIYRGQIGHRYPIPDAISSTQLTSHYIYEGFQVPLHLSRPRKDYPAALPRRITHEKFIELIRFWGISLLDALDYLSWEFKRTDGWMPVLLEVSELPRSPEVLDWIDAHSLIKIDQSWY